jgi:hypothetical protein
MYTIGDDLLDRTPELTEEPHTNRASHILRPLYDLAQKQYMLKSDIGAENLFQNTKVQNGINSLPGMPFQQFKLNLDTYQPVNRMFNKRTVLVTKQTSLHNVSKSDYVA